MEIFHPDGKQNKNNPKDTNADSLVLKLIFGESSFLFTGDLPIKEEEGLAGEGADIDSQIIKIAHHGSKYSTSLEFLEKVSPEDAIISVGKNNYGHPSAEVLERLEKEGIRTLRTDERGDIIYECDKESCFLAKTTE
jgi:competence protein ComEC